MAMKKLNSVAVTRSMPRSSPAEMVAPERETPGMSEKHCIRPIRRPSRRVTWPSPRWVPAAANAA